MDATLQQKAASADNRYQDALCRQFGRLALLRRYSHRGFDSHTQAAYEAKLAADLALHEMHEAARETAIGLDPKA